MGRRGGVAGGTTLAFGRHRRAIPAEEENTAIVSRVSFKPEFPLDRFGYCYKIQTDVA
jgi:hypothetical protein